MSIRRTIVELDTRGLNVTRFCAEHGISTWFFWSLRRRYAEGGLDAIEPRSRAPRRVANKTPVEVEDVIVAKRKELDDAGLDAGPASIAFHLRDLANCPSEATIWRVLKARGFITADPSKRPKRSGRRFSAARANECWQLDDTPWVLADGSEVKILNILDDHSRLLVASTALETCTGAASFTAFCVAAAVLGWPARFLSDNAKAFRETLAAALGELGVAARHGRPYHPQTTGKVERFHQTLKQWLAKQPPAHGIAELQVQLDIFRYLYNHQRPHRGLARQFPAHVWTHAPKSGPADHALQPTNIYRGIVNGGSFRAASRYRITLGATHNGKAGIAVITGTNCHVFVEGQLARKLTLDPTKVDHPLHNRPGRPTQLP